jgi:AcrR family transcriptional regulator
MSEKDRNTEEKIIQAAEKVFIERGMDGARMQQIADEAGINKALLHYYYRSKAKLFAIVFKTAFKTFMPNLLGAFKGDDDFFTKLRNFINTYLGIIEKNPHIPSFVLHEISHESDRLIMMLNELNINIDFIFEQVIDEIEKGHIRPIDPKHFFLNVVSLCIFPVVAKPMVLGILFKGDEKAYHQMMGERKTQVADFIIHSIKI